MTIPEIEEYKKSARIGDVICRLPPYHWLWDVESVEKLGVVVVLNKNNYDKNNPHRHMIMWDRLLQFEIRHKEK